MNIQRMFVDAAVAFASTLIVCIAVTLVWSLVVQHKAAVDWATSFRFAIVFGIMFGITLPLMGRRGRG